MGKAACVEGKYEKRDLDLDMDMQYLDAIYFGVQDGLKEMAESPEDLFKEAAFAAAIGMGVSIGAPVSGFVGMTGVLFSIHALYQSYEGLKDLDDNYARLREVARMVTISVVESIAEGAIRKAGSTVKEAAAEVALLVKDAKIWQSSCDWLKKNISDIADIAGSAAKSTVDGVLAKLRGGMNTLLYKYINRKADDIYAELASMMDEDALAYLQKEHGTADSAHMHLLRNVADGIESAAGEIQSRQISLKEVKYVNEALLEGVSKTKIQAMLKRIISTDELKFAEDDLVYGPSAGGKLKKLRDDAGGKLLTDLEKPMEYDWLTFSFRSIDKTVAKNLMIHFDLTNLKDVEGMLNNAGQYKDTITAHELRYIHKHWIGFSKNVKFYYHEMEILPPWEE